MTGKFLLGFAAILLTASSVHAQNANIEGRYESANTSLTVIVLDGETGDVAASTSVGSRGCGGGMSGLGKISGDVLKLTPFRKDEDGKGQCVITIKFDKARKSATLEEEGCLYYHGAACGWEGQKVTKRK